MTRFAGAFLWAILGFQGVWNPKLETIAIFVRPSLMFSNEIETSGGHISGTTAVWEVPLGFLDAPIKNTSKLEKCQKLRNGNGKSRFLVGRSLGFPLKLKLRAAITRVPRGVGSSQVGFWMLLGSLSIKAFSVKKWPGTTKYIYI